MPYTVVDDITVHYEVQGRGAPLLMLMGMGGCCDSWGSDFRAALADHFRLILPDNRGMGATTRGTAAYTIRRLVADAVGLLDAIGIRQAHVLGVSMGGMIAQTLAVDSPARVGGLVLGCTTPGGRLAVWGGPDRSAGERPGLLEPPSLLVTPEFRRRHPALLAGIALRALARPASPDVLRAQIGAIARFDNTAGLSRITAPTLVMTGDRDRLVPPENARILMRGIRGARGVIVRDAGHCFFWEAPERAANAIVEFLAPLAAAPAA